jgi:hypothetical protein
MPTSLKARLIALMPAVVLIASVAGFLRGG